MSDARTALSKMDARLRARRQRWSLRRAVLTALTVPFWSNSCVQPQAGLTAVGRIGATLPLTSAIDRSSQPGGLIAGAPLIDRQRATLCLASAIYYEAATEPDAGQRAVAQVVLNRVRHPAWPNTVCGVVYQGSNRPGCQFSYACDGAMARRPSIAWWIRARRVAEAALAGDTFAPVGNATFYHTTAVNPPWAARMTPVGQVGAHLFYTLPGSFKPDAYRGGEPHPGPLPRVAPVAKLLTVARIEPPIAVAPAVTAPVVTLPPPVPASTAKAASKPAPKASEDDRYIPGALPDSEVLPQWRNSGDWIDR